MNRKKLLKLLRGKGYKGDASVASVQAFLEKEGIDLVDADAKPIDVKMVLVQPMDGEDVEIVEPEAPDDEVPEEAQLEDGDEDERKTLAAALQRLDKLESDAKRRPKNRRTLAVDFANATGSSSRREVKRYNGRVKQYAEYPLTHKQRPVFDDGEQAEAAGAWFRRSIAGPFSYPERQRDEEILKSWDGDWREKAQVTDNPALGGALIPEDFSATLIELKESFGVARRVAGIEPMQGDTKAVPRLGDDVTVTAPGEAGAGTAADFTSDRVTLVAKKLMALNRQSSEILNDSALNVADIVTRSMAREFARVEDQMFFNGDGTSPSPFFGATGVRPKLANKSATVANIAGLVVGSGNAWSELTKGDFEKLVGLLPEHADQGNPVFVCHKKFFAEVLFRIMNESGGTQPVDIRGSLVKQFMGYPVEISQVFPKDEANSQIPILLGDFGMGAKFGEVSGETRIATSDQRFFDSDEIAIRSTERIAINAHDVGNASATPADREAGPIVGLITAAA